AERSPHEWAPQSNSHRERAYVRGALPHRETLGVLTADQGLVDPARLNGPAEHPPAPAPANLHSERPPLTALRGHVAGLGADRGRPKRTPRAQPPATSSCLARHRHPHLLDPNRVPSRGAGHAAEQLPRAIAPAVARSADAAARVGAAVVVEV